MVKLELPKEIRRFSEQEQDVIMRFIRELMSLGNGIQITSKNSMRP